MNESDMNQKNEVKSNPKAAALGIWSVFIIQFVSFLFINARNIAMPVIINDFDGMQLFSWMIALPALSGAVSTLLFGKLSDIFGRRIILIVSILIFIIGLAISAVMTSMTSMIAAATFMSIGHFPIVPLCFTAIGDLFPPEERAKWTGLLNFPGGVAALIGPVLGGIFSESMLGWQGIYWGTIPLILIAGGLAFKGLPKNSKKTTPKIDVFGTLVMIVATTTLIIGFSRLGARDGLLMPLLLIGFSVLAWAGFIQIEKRVAAPILDPHIFHNRVFMTVAAAAFLSFFGMLGIASYSPIFLQDVMQVDPTLSGSMLTPYSTIVAFLGIPAGFLLARTKKYKWMFISGYAVVTLALLAMWQFTAATPIWMYILITSLAGFGLGSIPTVNTLVAQFSVPKHLLGVAVGAMYFFQMVGISVAPAILGLAQNNAPTLEGGLKGVFLVGAITMLIALLLTITVPKISMDHKSNDSES